MAPTGGSQCLVGFRVRGACLLASKDWKPFVSELYQCMRDGDLGKHRGVRTFGLS